jgi:radical SAM superfamily enzyme YgiQ (UPF0313 family)
MPHVTLVPLVGFRIREAEMLAFGMTLPGLQARGAAIGQLPALGLLTLAGMLPENWTCSYLPVQTVDGEAVDAIIAERPDLVAISALTASTLDAYGLSDRLRAAGLRTVIGGLHATSLPDEAAAHCDAVVIGPGENVWHALLADVEANCLQRVYDARMVRAAPNWAMPRFDLIAGSPARYTLQTARGCPLACDFCAASRLLGPFVEKPVERVAAELAAIQRLARRPLIELADDNTFAGTRDPAPLFDALEASGARYFTEADWRIGERPEILAGLARSGCVQVLMGIESLVFRYPGMGQKHAELERILAAVERIQAAGVAVNGCFILGADGEDRASIERLVAFLLESPFAEIQLTLQTPFPGTQLLQRLQREGRILADHDWSSYTLFDVTYQPDRLSVRELEVGFREALSAVFNHSATARREQIRKRIWKAGRRCRRTT